MGVTLAFLQLAASAVALATAVVGLLREAMALAKALMAHCKAFLFPTLYEGFGIPPLEAAACGAPQIIVSDTPCMREVYGPCAAYIDLTANPGDVDDVTPATAPTAALLEKYSWDKSADRLLQILAK